MVGESGEQLGDNHIQRREDTLPIGVTCESAPKPEAGERDGEGAQPGKAQVRTLLKTSSVKESALSQDLELRPW